MAQLITDTMFVAFDIETTGLRPVVDRIVEIGAVKFCNGKIIDAFQELIDPQMPISRGASAVNGITDDMVREKPSIEHVLPRFLSFLGEATPVAHHAPFDVSFLSYDISRLGLTAPDRPVLDTCAIPKEIFPYVYSYSLDNLAAYLQIESEGLHRALADAKACMEILGKCVAEIGGPGQVTLDQILDINGPALSLNTGEILLEGPFHLLKQALEAGKEVEIVYCDARGSTTTRQITPIAIGLFRGTAMIEAFCHLRNEKRNFRLDRITEIRSKDRKNPSPGALFPRSCVPAEQGESGHDFSGVHHNLVLCRPPRLKTRGGERMARAARRN